MSYANIGEVPKQSNSKRVRWVRGEWCLFRCPPADSHWGLFGEHGHAMTMMYDHCYGITDYVKLQWPDVGSSLRARIWEVTRVPRVKSHLCQPCRSDGIYTKRSHNVLINAQKGVPGPGYRIETLQTLSGPWLEIASLRSLRFLHYAPKWPLVRPTIHHHTTSSFHPTISNKLLRSQRSNEWEISIQVPVSQRPGLKIDSAPTSLTISAPNHIQSALYCARMTNSIHRLPLRISTML